MQKRLDILKAAERLFYKNGFHAISTDRICSEAGVSTRTLYRHFPSRELLTEAAMEYRKRRFNAGLLAPHEPQALNQLFSVLAEWMDDEGPQGCFFLKAWGEYAAEEVRLAAHALNYRYELRAYIAACVTSSCGVKNEALTNAVWMLFEGAITSALILGSDAARHAGKAAVLMLSQPGAT